MVRMLNLFSQLEVAEKYLQHTLSQWGVSSVGSTASVHNRKPDSYCCYSNLKSALVRCQFLVKGELNEKMSKITFINMEVKDRERVEE